MGFDSTIADSIPVPSQMVPYSSLTCFAVTINYIIGSGLFSLPSAFQSAGWLLSLLCLFGFSALSIITLIYTIEVLARASGLSHMTSASDKPVVKISSSSEAQPLLAQAMLKSPYFPYLTYEKIDFSLLTRQFGGESLYYFTQLCLLLYGYTVLWSSTAIFSSSLALLAFPTFFGPGQTEAAASSTAGNDLFSHSCNIYNVSPSPECSHFYTLCVLVFAALVTYLSLQEIYEQTKIQVFLTFYRFFACFLMLGTCIYSFFYRNYFISSMDSPIDSSQEIFHMNSLPLWQNNGFGLIFCFAGVALNVHYNIPDILQPLKRKSQAARITISSLLVATGFYAIIGMICALEFGQSTLPLVTLNWEHYTGLGGGFQPLEWAKRENPDIHQIPYWAYLIRFLVLGFPMINQLSLFPLISITCGDNLRFLFPRLSKRSCRLLSCFPPFFLAIWIGKLDIIFVFTGLIAFFLELILPCLLQILSIKKVLALENPRPGENSLKDSNEFYGKSGKEWTIYSGMFSSLPVVYCVLGISILAFITAVFINFREGKL